ncbi:uncharacterized protein METZ01_LOCUS189924 [marine metagenome]|uniref:Uncharacterized protein n=1 Tax=marine metagenome TaxID=408172 RepID=A0A382DF22_9ZZZZ
MSERLFTFAKKILFFESQDSKFFKSLEIIIN